MTPDQARRLLEGATPGPWEWCEGKDQSGEFVALCGPDGAPALRTWDGDLYASGVHGTEADKALAAAAPALAAMAAGMHAEYRAEQQSDGGAWLPICGWDELDAARFFAEHLGDGATRIIRRYVTPEEEIS